VSTILKFKARLAFPKLFVAEQINGEGEPKFNAVGLLVPGTDDAAVASIEAAIAAEAREKWKDKADAMLTTLRAQDRLCLHDGNTKAQYDGFAGNKFLSASNASRPTVIDRDKTPLVAADGRPYAGCYVMMNVEIWAQDNKWGKRVNATLRGVQFHSDGDAFSASAPATTDEFDDLGAGADSASEFA
jgi:hypothetical protein